MIVYRGHGFWVPFIAYGCYIAVRGVHEDVLGWHGWRWWSAAAGLLLAGAIVWRWGRRLNGPLDTVTAELPPGSVPAGRHSLYGIRMEHWGVLFGAIGLAFVIVSLLSALNF